MSVRMRRCLWVVLAAGLAGCAASAPSLPLPPQPVAVEPLEGGAMPVAPSYSEVLVRTFVEDEEGRRREVGGAECRLEVGEYGVGFQSPGRVLVPVPRVGGPVLGVGCRAGEREGVARRALARDWVDPYPFGRRYPFGRPHDWWGDPFWGPRSGVWLGARLGDPAWGYRPRPRAGYVTGYPDVEVLLR